MAIALGILGQFFILIFSVTVHEMTHVLVAKLFGVKTRQIILTPLGEIAFMDSFEELHRYKQTWIVLAGPLINALMGITAFIFGQTKIAGINFMLCAFNMLPINPLDGSRILQIKLSSRMGILTINKILIRISRISSIIMMVLGILQTVLYPYNLTLLCMGLWVYNLNRKENIPMQMDFCRIMVGKKKGINRILPIKTLAAWEHTKVKSLIEKISWEYFFEIKVLSEDGITATINEGQIMSYVMKSGITGTLKDILA